MLFFYSMILTVTFSYNKGSVAFAEINNEKELVNFSLKFNTHFIKILRISN